MDLTMKGSSPTMKSVEKDNTVGLMARTILDSGPEIK